MYSSPRPQCVITPMRLLCVPDDTKIADSNPSIPPSRSCSALTLGSSPYTSSPTGAFAIAARIPADGCVTVSLRKSMIRSMSDLRIEAHLHLLGRAQYRAGLVLGLLPFALGNRIGDDAGS